MYRNNHSNNSSPRISDSTVSVISPRKRKNIDNDNETIIEEEKDCQVILKNMETVDVKGMVNNEVANVGVDESSNIIALKSGDFHTKTDI